ncbi:hypothetical protein [uncultured Lutibacter sp.]|uniref:hypothetical protein n=1 Tax=uncultured Lutibacter sp. TaxID=437739 RepID=UPI0026349FCF|nr:hypothetical protein [uncultured Lutibacter sp.]
MNDTKKIEGIINNSNLLKHLKFELINKEHVVSLIDSDGYEIVRGYGNTAIEALNDMHSNLL